MFQACDVKFVFHNYILLFKSFESPDYLSIQVTCFSHFWFFVGLCLSRAKRSCFMVRRFKPSFNLGTVCVYLVF